MANEINRMDSIATYLTRWGLLSVAGIIAFFVCMTVGPVMRESDQASILDGAIQLSRDGQLIGRDFYSYDKHWVVYILLAVIFYVSDLWQTGVNSDTVVATGNILASIIFCSGLSIFAFKVRWTSWRESIGFLAGALSPCVFLSAPLLSSNIIAAGFFLILLSILNTKQSWWREIALAFLAICSVGSRIDFALLMPIVCWGFAGENLKQLLKDSRCWALLFGSVTALLIGKLLAIEIHGFYGAFFNIKVVTAYLVFGLGGAGVVMCVFICRIFTLSHLSFGSKLFGVIALVLPLAAYSLQLFSPRHLLVVAMAVVSLSALKWGKVVLAEFSKINVWSITAAVVVPLCIGVNLESIRSPKLSLRASVYPTADGYWPMGGIFDFLIRIKFADSKSIDHNQKVWTLWKNLKTMEEHEYFVTPLVSFPKLRKRLLESEFEDCSTDSLSGDKVLIDEVGLRRLLGKNPKISWAQDDPILPVFGQHLEMISEYENTALFISSADKQNQGIENYRLRLAIADLFRGQDFTVSEYQESYLEKTRLREQLIFSDKPFTLQIGDEKFPSKSYQGRTGDSVEMIFFPNGINLGQRIVESQGGLWMAISSLAQPVNIRP